MIMQRVRAAAMAAALVGMASPAMAQVELSMYYPIAVGGPLTQVVDGMVSDFHKANPDIKVNAIYAGNYDDTRVRALSALKSGEKAQLSVLFSIDVYDLMEQDVIVPFSDVATSAEEKAWLNSFYPALMANGTIDGKVWGVPFQRSTIVLYYNKDAFKEVGLDPNSPPKTWAEMTEAAKKLTKDGRWGVSVPSTGYPYWMFQAFAIQNGIELMSADGTKTYFDSPAAIEALQYWRDLGAKHKVMPEGTVEWGTLRQAFLQGQTAMMWHTTGNLTAVKKEAKFDFGVAMLPASKRLGSPTGGGNFYLFKSATPEERKAALTFIRFMTAPERVAQWSIATGYVGVSPASYETKALKDYAASFPQAIVARDQLEHAVAEFSTYETGRVREALSNAVQSALTGRQTPEAAMKEAQATAERLLKSFQ
ncbi:MAG: ABC transporter substrate-binding protein [Alphaproteobacteria bacterium]|nr:ABC transporter substrate-binding protein [Alphaproteobacteria bacterium]MBU0798150.1 ABC transporter substrate-binding protein [Alphaproteobacteria bacterium]MBU0887033.1 ABC transporter substrate-binding protein [Alphaproteobacteria bacterium]MBU1814283.1 ABC transporter substrate-binding protein [Alphaproteobacteria bacterium]MBU2091704.1 ABC transporter substrate-binding protein [Alphaproteobacteria bacterium]